MCENKRVREIQRHDYVKMQEKSSKIILWPLGVHDMMLTNLILVAI